MKARFLSLSLSLFKLSLQRKLLFFFSIVLHYFLSNIENILFCLLLFWPEVYDDTADVRRVIRQTAGIAKRVRVDHTEREREESRHCACNSCVSLPLLFTSYSSSRYLSLLLSSILVFFFLLFPLLLIYSHLRLPSFLLYFSASLLFSFLSSSYDISPGRKIWSRESPVFSFRVNRNVKSFPDIYLQKKTLLKKDYREGNAFLLLLCPDEESKLETPFCLVSSIGAA